MSTEELQHELDVAHRVLEGGERGHALEHLARAFVLAPTDERVHACFEAIAQKADVLTLLSDEPYLGTKLVRAHALRRAGRVDEAVVQLAMIVEQFPALGHEVVLATWLVTAKAQGRSLGDDASDQLMRLLAVVGKSTIGLHRLLAGERALLAGYGELARAFVPFARNAIAASTAAGILRRVGAYDEALAALGDANQLLPLIQRGLTLRAMGEGARAAEAFAASGALEPRDQNFVVEQARSWFVTGDFDKANTLLKSLGALDGEEVVALAEACARGDRGSSADERVAVLDTIRRACVSAALDTPTDATANIFRTNAGQLPLGSKGLQIGISGWESPSNRLLAALYSTLTTDVTSVEYSIAPSNLPFDPASARRGSVAPLWIVRGGVLVQGRPAPSIELRHAIGKVAGSEGGFPALWERAEQLARTLDASRADDVVAALVHPPTRMEWLKTLPAGLYRYQVACACVLAALPGGFRKDLFESILFGPIDWCSAAAVVALAEVARRDPEHAREALMLLSETVSDLLPHSCEPRFDPLARVLQSLPCVPDSIVTALSAWHREHVALNVSASSDEAPESSHEPAAPPTTQGPLVSWRWVVAIALAVLILLELSRR